MRKEAGTLKIKIPDHVDNILKILKICGHSGYIVGGCVRDSLMGVSPHDYDVCTDCLPAEMQRIFSGFKTVETGLKHGTLTVISDGQPVEVTTFRSDGEYSDHRRPAHVTFERSLSEDLRRRDFTINAMAYDPEEGLTDLFGGQQDLKNGIIRCVGDAGERFDEDALRIMRCLRFASVTGFEIDSKTAAAARQKSGLLKLISAERIYSELIRLLCGRGAEWILLEYRDIIAVIIPELEPCFGCQQNCPHHIYDVYGHICRSVSGITPDGELRLCMLLHDIEKPSCRTTDGNGQDHFKTHPISGAKTAEVILRRLKCSAKTIRRITDLVREHDNRIPPQRSSVRRLISKYGYEFYFDWIKVRRADTLAQSDFRRTEKLVELDELERLGRELEKENCCVKISQLAVNGRDIMDMGLSGKAVGEALALALDAVMDEKTDNDRQQILDYLRRHYNEEA